MAPCLAGRRAADEITIRVWHGNNVRQVMTVSPGGSVIHGPVGGASNSTKVDIEIDPWAGFIVDNRKDFPTPVSLTKEIDEEQDVELGEEYDRRFNR